MGDVIFMAGVRARRARTFADSGSGRATQLGFAFDLVLPDTYFAAERLERLERPVAWTPALASVLYGGRPGRDAVLVARREAVEARADALRMPLVWPDRFPFDGSAAMRICALAIDLGRGAEFVLAASRLAFCGGFDLDDFEVLAEAAAAAGLPLDACLAAAGDRAVDEVLEARTLALRARGATRLPVLSVGSRLYCGEERLPEAAALARARVQAPRAG